MKRPGLILSDQPGLFYFYIPGKLNSSGDFKNYKHPETTGLVRRKEMSIERKLKREAQQAEDLQKKYIAEKEKAETGDQPPAQAEPVAPDQAQAAQPEAQATPAEPVAAATETPMEQAPAAAEPHPEDFNQKYKVLQGKYNAEVPRLISTIKEQKARLDSQDARIAGLERLLSSQAMPAPGPAPAPAQPSIGSSPTSAPREAVAPAASEEEPSQDINKRLRQFFTEDEIQDFGEDQCKLILAKTEKVFDKRAKQIVEDALKERNFDGKIEDVRQTAERPLINDHVKKLKESVPDLETINADPDFVAWLQVKDLMTGATRHQYLQHYHTNMQTDNVVSIFNLYKQEKGVFQGEAPAAPAAPTLGDIVEPSAGSVAQQSATPRNQKPVFKRGDWQKKYDELTEAKIRGNITGEKYKQQEAELLTAMNEGRVR